MLFTNDFRLYIDSLNFPPQFRLTHEEYADHVTFFFTETNFKQLSGELQIQVAKKMIDLFKYTIEHGIPSNLKVLE